MLIKGIFILMAFIGSCRTSETKCDYVIRQSTKSCSIRQEQTKPFTLSNPRDDDIKAFYSTDYGNIGKSQIYFLPDNIASNFPKMTGYFAEQLKLGTLRKEYFRELFNLEKLYLEQNEIDTVDSEAFRDLTNLKELSLEGNMIMSIDDDLFASLANLRTLSLNLNRIKTITHKAFWNLVNLEELDLSSNAIAELQPDVFTNAANLRNLNLMQNICIDCSFNKSNMTMVEETVKSTCFKDENLSTDDK